MSLTDWRNKIKPYESNLYFAALAALIVSLVWGLLALYQLTGERTPIRIEGVSHNIPFTP